MDHPFISLRSNPLSILFTAFTVLLLLLAARAARPSPPIARMQFAPLPNRSSTLPSFTYCELAN